MSKENVLPPKVNGKLSGHLTLKVDEIFWVRPLLGEVFVETHWWGEEENHIFRPEVINHVSKKIKEVDVSVTFNIRTSPRLFDAYLRKCDKLEFHVKKNRNNEEFGVAIVRSLNEAVFNGPKGGDYYPIFDGKGNRIGDIHIVFDLWLTRRKDEEGFKYPKFPTEKITTLPSVSLSSARSALSCSNKEKIVSSVLDQGEKLREAMTMSVLQDAPLDSVERAMEPDSNPRNQLKSPSEANKLVDFLIGKELPPDDEVEVIRALQALSPDDNVAAASQSNNKNYGVQSSYDGSIQNDDCLNFRPSSAAPAVDSQTDQTSSSGEVALRRALQLVNCYRLFIHCLHLSELGIKKVMCTDKKDVNSKKRTPPGVCYTVELLPLPSRRHRNPKPWHEVSHRFVSRKILDNEVIFSDTNCIIEKVSGNTGEQDGNYANLLLLWEEVKSSLQNATLKVFWRYLNQRLPSLLGSATITSDTIKAKGLLTTFMIPIVTNSGGISGHLSIAIELGNNRKTFGAHLTLLNNKKSTGSSWSGGGSSVLCECQCCRITGGKSDRCISRNFQHTPPSVANVVCRPYSSGGYYGSDKTSRSCSADTQKNRIIPSQPNKVIHQEATRTHQASNATTEHLDKRSNGNSSCDRAASSTEQVAPSIMTKQKVQTCDATVQVTGNIINKMTDSSMQTSVNENFSHEERPEVQPVRFSPFPDSAMRCRSCSLNHHSCCNKSNPIANVRQCYCGSNAAVPPVPDSCRCSSSCSAGNNQHQFKVNEEFRMDRDLTSRLVHEPHSCRNHTPNVRIYDAPQCRSCFGRSCLMNPITNAWHNDSGGGSASVPPVPVYTCNNWMPCSTDHPGHLPNSYSPVDPSPYLDNSTPPISDLENSGSSSLVHHEISISIDSIRGFPNLINIPREDIDCYVDYMFPTVSHSQLVLSGRRYSTEVSVLCSNGNVRFSSVLSHTLALPRNVSLTRALATLAVPAIDFNVWARTYPSAQASAPTPLMPSTDATVAKGMLQISTLSSLEMEFLKEGSRKTTKETVALPLVAVPCPFRFIDRLNGDIHVTIRYKNYRVRDLWADPHEPIVRPLSRRNVTDSDNNEEPAPGVTNEMLYTCLQGMSKNKVGLGSLEKSELDRKPTKLRNTRDRALSPIVEVSIADAAQGSLTSKATGRHATNIEWDSSVSSDAQPVNLLQMESSSDEDRIDSIVPKMNKGPKRRTAAADVVSIESLGGNAASLRPSQEDMKSLESDNDTLKSVSSVISNETPPQDESHDYDAFLPKHLTTLPRQLRDKYFKAKIEIERAINLPCIEESEKNSSSCYATFEAVDSNGIKQYQLTKIVSESVNPVWNAIFNVYLPVEYLYKCDKGLTVRVMRGVSGQSSINKNKPSVSSSKPPAELSANQVGDHLGAPIIPIEASLETVIDVTALGTGFPALLGWFTLKRIDGSSCQTKPFIKLKITPSEDVSKFKQIWAKEYNEWKKSHRISEGRYSKTNLERKKEEANAVSLSLIDKLLELETITEELKENKADGGRVSRQKSESGITKVDQTSKCPIQELPSITIDTLSLLNSNDEINRRHDGRYEKSGKRSVTSSSENGGSVIDDNSHSLALTDSPPGNLTRGHSSQTQWIPRVVLSDDDSLELPQTTTRHRQYGNPGVYRVDNTCHQNHSINAEELDLLHADLMEIEASDEIDRIIRELSSRT